MEKAYNAALFEEEIQNLWEQSGAYTPPENTTKNPFTIILPPPNANADLHVGHAMFVIEDIMARFHRMQGDPTLWLPGADHAGFETQFVFEKHLAKQDKSRFDYTREELFSMIWDFVHQNRGNMENQLKRLGFSLDWSRRIFTLDPKIVSIVYKTFKKLHDDGLIYRDYRLVNYCTRCGTGFSDLEVISQEQTGTLYEIPLTLSEDPTVQITIATTRPETMVGDVAVMVHPNDERYQKYIGKHVRIPLVNREIPIIADEYVDPTFGTGAVKVTPNHDHNDFAIAKKHHLSFPSIISFSGRMQNTGLTELDGKKVKAAREIFLALLADAGITVTTKPHTMVIKTCYKCSSILEPLPLAQWYVKVKPLTEKAISAIEKNEVTFVPERFRDHALQWLTNFHDWNISRQIVWGIRIPAWKCLDCTTSEQQWIVTDGAVPDHCPDCKSSNLEQDPDTFDTWFSSGQWPFATLQTTQPGDFEKYYPTSVMETGYDILPWWVCRMLMLGLYVTNKVPFKTVYLHGLVRDGKGQKMSKSKGNVINPLTMIEKYGADSLRLALVFGSAAGNDLSLSDEKVRGMRNFVNKLWNMIRFYHFYTTDLHQEIDMTTPVLPEDQQLKDSLTALIDTTTVHMQRYRFSDAIQELHEFAWHTVADHYFESIKDRLKNKDMAAVATVRYTLQTLLKLLHPFAPFVTEVLWQEVKDKEDNLLIITAWPK